LWKDAAQKKEAAKVLKLTAPDLLSLGIIDEIVQEPEGGAHRNSEITAKNLKESILRNLKELSSVDIDALVKSRYDKFRKMGVFKE
jgi:acetyl-CoA carboxylase carboxyl transferase subunit alpha